MMYYFLKYNIKTVESADLAGEGDKASKFSGWTLDDTNVIKEIDGSENLDFLNVRLKNNGEIYSNSKQNVKSAKNFETMTKFAEGKIKETGEKILTGNIEVKPVKMLKSDACKYCIYGELCGFKSDKISNVKLLDDNKILEIMEEAYK